MAIDSPQSNNSGNQTDAVIQRAVHDINDGQNNNQAFSLDVMALYTLDRGNQTQLKTDLAALNQQLQKSNVLPGLELIGEDANGDVLYLDPASHEMSMWNDQGHYVDSGDEQVMLPKYSSSLLQNQPDYADQASTPAPGGDQGSAPAPGGDQASAPAPGGDQASAPAPGGDQGAAPTAGGSGQPETWGQNGRQYTPGQDGAYTHVVQPFQGADKPGDDMYRIATDSLDNQHNNDPNYKPTDQEVMAEVQRIAEFNKDDGTIGQPPAYTIKVGDTINIPPKDWTAPAADNKDSGNDSPAPGPDVAPAAKDTPAPGDPPASVSAGPDNEAPARDYSTYAGAQSGQASQSDSAPYIPGGQGGQVPQGDSALYGAQSGQGQQAGGDYPPYGAQSGQGQQAGGDYPPYGAQSGQGQQAGGDYPPYGAQSGQGQQAGGDYPPYGAQSGQGQQAGGDTPPYAYPGAESYPPGYQSGQPGSYPPNYDYPPTGSDAPGYQSGQPGNYPPNYEYPPTGNGAPPYAYPGSGSGTPPYGYAPPPAYESPSYGYPPVAYEPPSYGYPPAAYEVPAPEPVVIVNPVGIVRDVARLFRR